MKTKIFKTIFPMLAFMMAITAAFAFSKAPADKAVFQVIGHIKNSNGSCTPTDVMCETVKFDTACVNSSSTVLYRLSGTTCPNQLWRIP
jgi:hypothetical protein